MEGNGSAQSEPNQEERKIAESFSSDHDCDFLDPQVEFTTTVDLVPVEARHEKEFTSPESTPRDVFIAPAEKVKIEDEPATSTRSAAPPQFDDETCEFGAKMFMKTEFIPEDKNERYAVVQYMQRQTAAAAKSCDYDKADYYFHLGQRYLEACHLREREEIKDTRTENIETQITKNEEKLLQVRKKWDDKMAGLENDFYMRNEEAKRHHTQTMQEFQDHWKNPDNLRAYTKPSASLLKLRETERKMVLAKMFKEARVLKQRADALQNSETREAQQNAQYDISSKREALLKSQADQLDRIAKYKERKVFELNKEKSIEEAGIEKRLDNLKLQLERIQSKPPNAVVQRPKTAISKASNTASIIGLKSPRTMKEIDSYRRNVVVKKLTLRGIRSSQKAKPAAGKSRVTTAQQTSRSQTE